MTDPEAEELEREAKAAEASEADEREKATEQYIEATERRLQRLLQPLGQLPPPVDFDRSEQNELASAWAPIVKDWDIPDGADAPPWVKWAYAIVTTAIVCAPKALAAHAMAQQQRSAPEPEPETEPQPEQPSEGRDDD